MREIIDRAEAILQEVGYELPADVRACVARLLVAVSDEARDTVLADLERVRTAYPWLNHEQERRIHTNSTKRPIQPPSDAGEWSQFVPMQTIEESCLDAIVLAVYADTDARSALKNAEEHLAAGSWAQLPSWTAVW
jgi:hypothetical protein